MEFFWYLLGKLTDGLDAFANWFPGFWQYAMTVAAVPENKKLILLIGGLFAVIVVMFIIFTWPSSAARARKKSRRSRAKLTEQPAREMPLATAVITDPKALAKLGEIEEDMLTLKELYQSGDIDIESYVNDSRSLYERAKQLA
jgi:uncharacterized membrane protein